MPAVAVASLRERFRRHIKDFEADLAYLERGNYLYAGPIMSPMDVTEPAKERARHTISELKSAIDAIDRELVLHE